MRILFVSAGYLPEAVGGVELHVAGLARAMTAAGHECAVFTRTGRPDVAHLATVTDTFEGVPVTRMGNTFEDATSLELIYAHEGIADVFMASVEAFSPDLVHIHHLTCLSTRIVDRLTEAGIPTVMTLHDFWMGCPRGQRITSALEPCPVIDLSRCVPCLRELWPHLLGAGAHSGTAVIDTAVIDTADREAVSRYHDAMLAVLGKVTALVTPSVFMRDTFEAQGVPVGRIEVVENGLPTGRWAGVAAERAAGTTRAVGRAVGRDGASGAASGPGQPGTPLRVGYIGSVLASKGVHVLLEAARRLPDPARVVLDIWGEVLPFHHDRDYGARLDALRQGHEASIRLHGRYAQERLPGILAELDVVVVPSLWYEAYCLTIREARLAGVAVVVSDHGALAEAVRHDVDGLLFTPGDADALAAALSRLLDEPGLAARLVAASPTIRDESEAALQLRALYDRCVAGHVAPDQTASGDGTGPREPRS